MRAIRLQRVSAGLRWGVFALALAVASLFVTWHALAALDFGYGLWYELIGIDRTIERYAPANRYRDGFQLTSEAERARLFGRIVDAIHAGGAGLEGLRYHAPDGRVLGPLLREPEIVHLRDVAALVRVFEWAGWTALALLVLLAAYARRRRDVLPPLRHFAGGAAAVLAAVGALLIVAGPVPVFYWLHERIFPPEHPWFFYYEDSLMSTLMQAPNLFGAIAAVWAALALLVAGLVLWAVGRWLAPARRGDGEAP